MRRILHLSVLLLIIAGVVVDSVSLSAQSENDEAARV